MTISPSGETNDAVQPPSDTTAPIGCPVRSANALGSPLNPSAFSWAESAGICCGIHMPSSAHSPASSSIGPMLSTRILVYFMPTGPSRVNAVDDDVGRASPGHGCPEHTTTLKWTLLACRADCVTARQSARDEKLLPQPQLDVQSFLSTIASGNSGTVSFIKTKHASPLGPNALREEKRMIRFRRLAPIVALLALVSAIALATPPAGAPVVSCGIYNQQTARLRQESQTELLPAITLSCTVYDQLPNTGTPRTSGTLYDWQVTFPANAPLTVSPAMIGGASEPQLTVEVVPYGLSTTPSKQSQHACQ